MTATSPWTWYSAVMESPLLDTGKTGEKRTIVRF
jgi:hypothetical protein